MADLNWTKVKDELPSNIDETYLVVDDVGDIHMAYYTKEYDSDKEPIWLNYDRHTNGKTEEIDDVKIWTKIPLPDNLFELLKD